MGIILGLIFSIPGFFGVEKFGKYFLGGLIEAGIFGGIKNNLKILGSTHVHV